MGKNIENNSDQVQKPLLYDQIPGEEKLILGLDLGVTSVGWALVRHTYGQAEDFSEDTGEVVDAGSHIFQAVFEPKSLGLLNLGRRRSRLMRRRTERTRMRLDHLTKILREHQMLPKLGAEWNQLFFDHDIHPLLLRAKGLDEELSLSEFGRCLFHIGKRRGFKSNKGIKVISLEIRRRKGRPCVVVPLDPEIRAVIEEEKRKLQSEKPETDLLGEEEESTKPSQKDKSKEDKEAEGVVLKAISELRTKIKEVDAKSLGQYLFWIVSEKTEDGRALLMNKVRGIKTARDLYETEFNLLWEKQAQFHPRVLTEALKAEIHNAIFFQRPLKIQRFLVGKCQFEPKRNRARVGYPISQEFRIWQDLNNLVIEGRRFDKKSARSKKEEDAMTLFNEHLDEMQSRRLTLPEKEKIAALLMDQRSVTWTAIKKELGFPSSSCDFNLERSKSKGLLGSKTRCEIKKTVSGLWDDLQDGKYRRIKPSPNHPAGEPLTVDNLIEDLFSITDSGALLNHLRSFYGLSARDAYKLATLDLETTTMGLSTAAMRKILPFMKEGLGYSEAVTAAGYIRRDEQTTAGKPRLSYKDLKPTRNPTVDKCLSQTVKVVNRIISDHGDLVPDIIRIEMARDMKLTQKEKDEAKKENNKREKERKLGAELYESVTGLKPGRDDLLKYQLWVECGGSGSQVSGICPYTGKTISLSQLFSSEIEIEHIIPWATCLDDSFNNKTLCFSSANAEKARRTPRQAFGSDPQRWQEMVDRVLSSGLSKGKQKRFFIEDKDLANIERAAGRLLSDTRYLSRACKEVFFKLGCEVEVGKGAVTAILRRNWGLNTILQTPDKDTGEVENKKNRDDHRHHALDAIVIALTDLSLMKRLSTMAGKQGGASLSSRDLKIKEPWPYFRGKVEAVMEPMIVTFEPRHKVSGALTEESIYGLRQTGRDKWVRTFRKEVGSLTEKMIDQVRSRHMRELLKAEIAKHPGDFKAAQKSAFGKGAFEYTQPNGKVVKVRSVRCEEAVPLEKLTFENGEVVAWKGYAPFKNGTGKIIGWMATGGNHHLAIYEKASGDRWAEAISMYEAYRRVRSKENVYQAAANGDRLVMALHKDDLVKCDGEVYRLATVSTDPGLDLGFRRTSDAKGGVKGLKEDGGIRMTSPKGLQMLLNP